MDEVDDRRSTYSARLARTRHARRGSVPALCRHQDGAGTDTTDLTDERTDDETRTTVASDKKREAARRRVERAYENVAKEDRKAARDARAAELAQQRQELADRVEAQRKKEQDQIDADMREASRRLHEQLNIEHD